MLIIKVKDSYPNLNCKYNVLFFQYNVINIINICFLLEDLRK